MQMQSVKITDSVFAQTDRESNEPSVLVSPMKHKSPSFDGPCAFLFADAIG